MAWKKVPPELAEFLEAATAGYPVLKKTMFGCPAYFVNGNMFAAAHQENIVLRLSEAHRRELRALSDEARPFEPMAGRKMKEYLALPESLFADPARFAPWLQKAFEYARGLPAKKEKKK